MSSPAASNPAKSPRRRNRRALGPRGRGHERISSAKKLDLLRRSFTRIEAQGAIVGLVFYQRLFTLEPSLRSLFHTSIELQSRKLMDSLSYTVAALESPKTLVPILEAMGRRHVAYGVREEHYDVVIRALMETFGQVLGDAFSPELREAWRQALCFVAETMKSGSVPSRCWDSNR
jgi:hemoglobin-like flavoprotein